MFCDGCGASLQTGQGFCGQCGKEVKDGMHIAFPRRGRVQEHVRLLGILWLALSALDVVGGGTLLILANTIFAPGMRTPGPGFLHSLMTFLGVFVLAKAFAGFFAGWGLLQREAWARAFSLWLAFISLFFNVPFGTIVGVYTMWVFLPAQSEKEYEEQAQSFGAARA